MKSERAPQQHVLIVELKRLDLTRMRLTIATRQFRLGVEEVHLRRTAILEKLNDRSRSTVKLSGTRA